MSRCKPSPAEATCTLEATNNTTDNYGAVSITVGPTEAGAPAYGTVEPQTALAVGAAGGTITLDCQRSAGTPNVQLYQARIIATRVETLTEP